MRHVSIAHPAHLGGLATTAEAGSGKVPICGQMRPDPTPGRGSAVGAGQKEHRRAGIAAAEEFDGWLFGR
jgi:hypothetical protein